jgi:hypothetical protein
MEVRNIPKDLADVVMNLAEQTYKEYMYLSEYNGIDVYSIAYTLGYEEAWERHSTLKYKMFITDQTRGVIANSAKDFYSKNTDKFQDIKSTHDIFMYGYMSGYIMFWNCSEEIKDRHITD